MAVKLIHATPDLEGELVRIARVSSDPTRQPARDADLIAYLIRNQHWSPFEMVSVCMHIETTRDIGRQILRHRSFSFQEFSQRYQSVEVLTPARMQHPTNRQSSIPSVDQELNDWWQLAQDQVQDQVQDLYRRAIGRGIAKEVARKILPEGLTQSSLYMHGTLRSWIHYCQLRMGNGTQLEHQRIAEACWDIITHIAPSIK